MRSATWAETSASERRPRGTPRGSSKRFSSLTGGRQGCTLGSTVFNSAYCVALDAIHWRLRKEGVILRVQSPPGACWCPAQEDEAKSTEVIDVTFVDDEAMMLVARSVGTMLKYIDILLDTVTSVFRRCHLELNWGPGKSECACCSYEATVRRQPFASGHLMMAQSLSLYRSLASTVLCG